VDRQARERHDIQTPRMWTFSLAIAPDGGAWVVRGGDTTSKSVSLLRLAPEGNRSVNLTGEPCPSRTFTLWGPWLVFYTDPALGREICNVSKKFLA
jgi:hypothetical protein